MPPPPLNEILGVCFLVHVVEGAYCMFLLCSAFVSYLHLCLTMSVCLYLFVRVCLCVCVCACTSICVHVSIYACGCVCACVNVYIYASLTAVLYLSLSFDSFLNCSLCPAMAIPNQSHAINLCVSLPFQVQCMSCTPMQHCSCYCYSTMDLDQHTNTTEDLCVVQKECTLNNFQYCNYLLTNVHTCMYV